MTLALVLSFVSGFIALSYEIVWYRAFSLGMSGRAHAFGLLLVGYLLGIAAGAWLSRLVCAGGAPTRRATYALAVSVLAANVLGFLFVPLFATLMTKSGPWMPAVGLLVVTVAGLGSIFPLIAHICIPAGPAVGRQFSRVYAANILGSTLGSVLTGLVLLDHMSAAALMTALGVAGVSSAAGIVATARPARRVTVSAVLAGIAASLGMIAASPSLFDGTYEKLIFKRAYAANPRFAHVIETRSGVVTAAADGTVFGNGLWDGVVNTDLRRNGVNGVSRAYMIGALHPAPKHVLFVGLGAGAWAAVLAAHPGVERLTVVEVDAGHVQLLQYYPAVSSLTSDPKVRIEIDDIRRWLARHPDEKFDVIVGNPTFNWRANATSLLSREYLQLMRQHLNPGGVYFYNTTGENRVALTGAQVFPFCWRVGVMLAVSDQAFSPNFDRFRADLAAFRLGGVPALRLDDPADAAVLDEILNAASHDVESRDSLLTRLAALRPITDDNMGTEWPLAHRARFWRY